MTSIEDAQAEIVAIIDTVNWHQPMTEPNLTIKMVEAKAKLMDAEKILRKIQTALEESCCSKK